jgi:hypothetical protein
MTTKAAAKNPRQKHAHKKQTKTKRQTQNKKR